MEGPPNSHQVVEPQPEQTEMTTNWRPPAYNLVRSDEAIPRRLEWIAVILFVVNFFLMLYTVALYYGDEAWALAMAAISTATGVVLLLAVIFSILGRMGLSKITLVAGILGVMVSVVSLGAKLMQMISEMGDYF